MSVSMAFIVGLCYKHIVLKDFLDLLHLHGRSISVDFSYITRKRFGRFKTHARMESFVCEEERYFCIL